MILCIANQKGGVGKTTTAVNIAHGLALKRQETLLIDLDPQGQCATALGLDPEPGVFDFIIARRPLKELIRPARPGLWLLPGDQSTADVQTVLAVQQKPIDQLLTTIKPYARSGLRNIVIDTSPSVGGLQERALFAADLVIIPSETKFLAADSVARTVITLKANMNYGWKGKLLGILPTFFDERTNESKATLQDLNQLYPDQVLGTIHQATILAECAAAGKTIWEVDGDGRAGHEYAALLYQVIINA